MQCSQQMDTPSISYYKSLNFFSNILSLTNDKYDNIFNAKQTLYQNTFDVKFY